MLRFDPQCVFSSHWISKPEPYHVAKFPKFLVVANRHAFRASEGIKHSAIFHDNVVMLPAIGFTHESTKPAALARLNSLDFPSFEFLNLTGDIFASGCALWVCRRTRLPVRGDPWWRGSAGT